VGTCCKPGGGETEQGPFKSRKFNFEESFFGVEESTIEVVVGF